jgi:hypothetical protein
MANSAFDPLRGDPFAAIEQPAAIVPVSNPTQPNNQWSVQPGEGQQQQQPEASFDILLQFNNTSISSPPQMPGSDDVIQNRTRRANSTASAASSLGSRSARSGSGSNVLDDMTIAPPPEVPIPRDYTRSLFLAEEEVNPGSPPDFDMIKHSGTVRARISMRTLLMKNWKEIFWVAYGNYTLLFFKSKINFEDWAMNPHLSTRQREALVKLRIDFQNPDNSTHKDKETIKGFQASTVKGKVYNKNGMLHQFKLDKWTDQGPTIAAAFGSESYQDIYELHLIVAEMIGKSPGGAGLAELGHSRDAGEDSSGYFSGAQSVGSNPTFARRAPGQSDDKSNYSEYSSRSAGSYGSKSKYIVNNIKKAASFRG